MKFHRALAAMAAVLSVYACGGSDSTDVQTTQISPVTVDGVRSPGEWDDATQVSAFAGSTFLYKNDGGTLYLALEVEDATLDGTDILDIRFDNTRNGALDEGEDNIGLTGDGTFTDKHFANSAWALVDDESDGSGAVAASGGVNFFELSHPLDSGDTDDFSLQPGDRVGYCIIYFKDNIASDATMFPAGCNRVGADLSGYMELVVK